MKKQDGTKETTPAPPKVFPPIKPKVWREILECKKLSAQMRDLDAEVKKHVPLAANRALTALVVTHGVKRLGMNTEQTSLTITLGNNRKLVFVVSDTQDAWITYTDKVYDSASDPALTENREKYKALNTEFKRRHAQIPDSDWHASLFGKRC